MNQDQFPTFNPNNPLASPSPDLRPHLENEAIFVQPLAPAAKTSVRQQVLDRILDKIREQDLLAFGAVIAASVIVFLVLLLTDILGYTDIFPFVK